MLSQPLTASLVLCSWQRQDSERAGRHSYRSQVRILTMRRMAKIIKMPIAGREHWSGPLRTLGAQSHREDLAPEVLIRTMYVIHEQKRGSWRSLDRVRLSPWPWDPPNSQCRVMDCMCRPCAAGKDPIPFPQERGVQIHRGAGRVP